MDKHPRFRWLAVTLIGVALFLIALDLPGDIFLVSNTADSGPGSLRWALEQANNNPGADEIHFNEVLNGETIELTTGSLEICDDLRLVGPGDDLLILARTEVVPAQAFRVFEIDDGLDDSHATVEISGVTITNGLVRPSTGDARGGGILNREDLTIIGSKISGNRVEPANEYQSDTSGGGVHSEGPLTLSDTVVSDNHAGDDGFQGWETASKGGGISSWDELTIYCSTVSGNEAYANVLYSWAGGGGIYARQGGTIVASTISDNTAAAGGGYASGGGGGISSREVLYIHASSISGNSLGSYGPTRGGGIDAWTVLVYDSVINGNVSNSGGLTSSSGGGIFADSCTIHNSTISGNSVDGLSSFGGGVRAHGGAITASTIVGNYAAGDSNGGGISIRDATTLMSTIVAGNTHSPYGSSHGPDVSADTPPYAWYNLIGDPAGSNIIIGGEEGNITGDPLLGILQDNGGPTHTHALDPASPAVDAGANPTGLSWDQRRYGPRAVNGRADIGAYELGALPVLFGDGFESGDTSNWARQGP